MRRVVQFLVFFALCSQSLGWANVRPGINRLASIRETLFRPQGFGIVEFQGLARFPLSRRGGGSSRFPNHVRLIDLTAPTTPSLQSRLRAADRIMFAFGLQRTAVDPPCMPVPIWTYHTQLEAVPQAAVTAYAALWLERDNIRVAKIQPTFLVDPLGKQQKHIVKNRKVRQAIAFLDEKRGQTQAPGAGSPELRLRALRTHANPWAYCDRALLLVAAVKWLGLEIGYRPDEVVIPTSWNGEDAQTTKHVERTYQRYQRFYDRCGVHER